MNQLLTMACMAMGTATTIAYCAPETKQDKFAAQMVAPDSVVYSMLGRTMSDVLFNPKKVTLFRLTGKDTITAKDYEVESHYVRDSALGRVCPEIYSVFQFNVLSDSANYKHDSIPVRAPYIPQYELEFTKGKAQVHVILSPNDNSWTIMYDDKRQGRWNFANHQSILRYIDLLLKTSK